MRARIAVVILGLGLTACSLLQLRQARLQAAHELAAAHKRARDFDDETLRLRAELSRAAMEAVREPIQTPPATLPSSASMAPASPSVPMIALDVAWSDGHGPG